MAINMWFQNTRGLINVLVFPFYLRRKQKRLLTMIGVVKIIHFKDSINFVLGFIL